MKIERPSRIVLLAAVAVFAALVLGVLYVGALLAGIVGVDGRSLTDTALMGMAILFILWVVVAGGAILSAAWLTHTRTLRPVAQSERSPAAKTAPAAPAGDTVGQPARTARPSRGTVLQQPLS